MDDGFESEPLISSGDGVVRDSELAKDAAAAAPRLDAATVEDPGPTSPRDLTDDAPVDGVIEVEPAVAHGEDSSSIPGDQAATPGSATPQELSDSPDTLAAIREIRDQLAQLVEETAKYHERASQRESVIDSMHGELEQLRRGERRSLLRPLITEVCRLRDDLLRQADTLPGDFDRERAADLLRSYADSLEFTLEDNGITTFTPEAGEAFQARLHRVASKAPTRDRALVGTIADVVSPGYRDGEYDTVIAGARVVVHIADESEPDSAVAPAPDAAAGLSPDTPFSESEPVDTAASAPTEGPPTRVPDTAAASDGRDNPAAGQTDELP